MKCITIKLWNMNKNRCWQCGGLIDDKNQGHWHWCSHNMDTDQNEQYKDD